MINTKHTDSFGHDLYDNDYVKVGGLKGYYLVVWDMTDKKWRLKQEDSDSGFSFRVAVAKYKIKRLGNKRDGRPEEKQKKNYNKKGNNNWYINVVRADAEIYIKVLSELRLEFIREARRFEDLSNSPEHLNSNRSEAYKESGIEFRHKAKAVWYAIKSLKKNGISL